MSGVIQGGWDYVAAAWALSVGGLVAYATLISFQLRAARRAADRPKEGA